MAQKEWIGINEQPRNLADWIKQLLQSLNIRIREGKSMKYADIMADAMFQQAKDAVTNIADIAEKAMDNTASQKEVQYLIGSLGENVAETVANSYAMLTDEMKSLKGEVGVGNLENLKVLKEIEKDLTDKIGKLNYFVNGIDLLQEEVKADEKSVMFGYGSATVFLFPSYEEADAGITSPIVVLTESEHLGTSICQRQDFASVDDFKKSELYQKLSSEAEVDFEGYAKNIIAKDIAEANGKSLHDDALLATKDMQKNKEKFIRPLETLKEDLRSARENEKGMERF